MKNLFAILVISMFSLISCDSLPVEDELPPDYREGFIGTYEGVKVFVYSHLDGVSMLWLTHKDTSDYVIDVSLGIGDSTIALTYPDPRNDTIPINSAGFFESEYWVSIGNKDYFHYNVRLRNDSIDIYYDYDFGTEHSQVFFTGRKL